MNNLVLIFRKLVDFIGRKPQVAFHASRLSSGVEHTHGKGGVSGSIPEGGSTTSK